MHRFCFLAKRCRSDYREEIGTTPLHTEKPSRRGLPPARFFGTRTCRAFFYRTISLFGPVVVWFLMTRSMSTMSTSVMSPITVFFTDAMASP